MAVAKERGGAPIALKRDEGEAVWFFGTLAIIKTAGEASGGRLVMIENFAPQGSGSPLHVHRREDEWFYVLEGELTFWLDGRVIPAPAGSLVYGPRDIPHTFIVSSPAARFLLVAEPAGFECFVRTLGEPAKALTMPPPTCELPDTKRAAEVAAEYGIEILGPPGIPDRSV